jgi:hypothetical protein
VQGGHHGCGRQHVGALRDIHCSARAVRHTHNRERHVFAHRSCCSPRCSTMTTPKCGQARTRSMQIYVDHAHRHWRRPFDGMAAPLQHNRTRPAAARVVASVLRHAEVRPGHGGGPGHGCGTEALILLCRGAAAVLRCCAAAQAPAVLRTDPQRAAAQHAGQREHHRCLAWWALAPGALPALRPPPCKPCNAHGDPWPSRDSKSALAARAPIGLPFPLPEAGWGIGGLLCEGEQARQLHAGQGLNGQAGPAAQARQAWSCYTAAQLEPQRQMGWGDE